MTEDEYWDIVAKVDWPGICDDANAHRDAGKHILFELLPTQVEMEQFRNMHYGLKDTLVNALLAWDVRQCLQDPNWAGWGIGDDGFEDLTNHIVGCGKAEWAATCKDPSKAYDRICLKYGGPANKKSDGYVESFFYCIPFESDYDSPSVKLPQALRRLKHWISMAAKNSVSGSTSAMQEVESVVKEIVRLEDMIAKETGERTNHTADVPERIHELKVVRAKRELANCLGERIEIEMKIKTAQENLDSLLAEQNTCL